VLRPKFDDGYLDPTIRKAVYELNKRKFHTFNSCGGHRYRHRSGRIEVRDGILAFIYPLKNKERATVEEILAKYGFTVIRWKRGFGHHYADLKSTNEYPIMDVGD
jgi:hypothetical protein